MTKNVWKIHSAIVEKLRQLVIVPILLDPLPQRKGRGKFKKSRMTKPRALVYTRGKPVRKNKA